jgi:hypothetical protein
MSGMSRAIVLGTLAKTGVEGRYANSGTACASFTLIMSDRGGDGKSHEPSIPCACGGKKAEAASESAAGQLTICEGKLAKRRKGEQWELFVSGCALTPVASPAPAMRGHQPEKEQP